MIKELFETVNEMYARDLREVSVHKKFHGISWDDLCNSVIKLAAKLKTPKEVDEG